MYEFIDNSIDKLKRRTQIAFNNSRLELLKSDELNLLQVKKETNRLYKKLREESEKFLKELLEDLSDRLHFNKDEFLLEYFLEAISPVLLYSCLLYTSQNKNCKYYQKKEKDYRFAGFYMVGAGGYCKRGYCEKQFRRKKR